MVTSKKIKVVHVDKGNDKIVITPSAHNISIGPMTHSKVKSTSALLGKQASIPLC